jgi:predicted TIM-barrel fold metal-dependent hydrolase
MTATAEQGTKSSIEIPRIVSVDDHVVEPAHLWQTWLPEKWRDRGPKVERRGVAGMRHIGGGTYEQTFDDASPEADCWVYEDLVYINKRHVASVGFDRDDMTMSPITYDEMRPGCYEPKARLDDMDINWVEASLSFPTFPRFCGQTFLEAKDRDLAEACVYAYNDWMVEEWCGDSGGRLIPLTLIPLWDPHLAAAEVRRCADKGSHAVAFSENPTKLGLPSLYSGKWDPFLGACAETETTVSMHIGSSSTMPTTSPDAPLSTSMALSSQNAQGSVVDWVFSGTLARYPELKVVWAESQIGWLPYLLERMDLVWKEGVGDLDLPNSPSSYARDRIWGCVFDDQHGLVARDAVGMGSILFETDYPHSDGTFPRSREVAHRLCAGAGLDAHECWQFLRGNAIKAYGLERFGITE